MEETMRRFILAGSILALCACGADETSEAPAEDAAGDAEVDVAEHDRERADPYLHLPPQ